MGCLDPLGAIMQGVLDCARDSLTDCGRPVGSAFLAPGEEVAHDDCCEDSGQLAARLVEIVPVPPPGPNCGQGMARAVLGVSVIRCAHTLDGRGEPPTPSQMTGDALSMTGDAQAVLDAMACCARLVSGVQRLEVIRFDPIGPLGGCAGGEWQVRVLYDPCLC